MVSTEEAIAIAVEIGKLRQLAVRHGGGIVGVEKAFRELAMRYHPDRGGDPVTFRRLTAARDSLMALFDAHAVALAQIPDTKRDGATLQ